MALTYTPEPELGTPAPDFALPDVVSGKTVRLADFRGAKALVVAFICQHCPYVQAVQGRIARLARETEARGVRFVAICSNDAAKYPADSPANLKKQAEEQGFVFPYLHDDSQAVARAYGAVCTPDFFIYGADLKLAYRGRLDDSWKDEAQVTRREMAEALDAIVGGRAPASEQKPAMGCSIKWK